MCVCVRVQEVHENYTIMEPKNELYYCCVCVVVGPLLDQGWMVHYRYLLFTL